MTHDERAVYLLRDDVESWRTLAGRWIRIGVVTQLHLNTTERLLKTQADELETLRQTVAEQQEQIDAMREELQCRMGKR